jgi:hypothetical protein
MDDESKRCMVEVRANTAGSGPTSRRCAARRHDAGRRLRAGGHGARARAAGGDPPGSLGFDDLKRIALDALSQIAAQALHSGIGALFGPAAAARRARRGCFGGDRALLGLPGAATGGPVAPGAAYLVGERGPEVFVPTSAGRVEPSARGRRDVGSRSRSRQPRVGRTDGCAVCAAVASSVRRAARA